MFAVSSILEGFEPLQPAERQGRFPHTRFGADRSKVVLISLPFVMIRQTLIT